MNFPLQPFLIVAQLGVALSKIDISRSVVALGIFDATARLPSMFKIVQVQNLIHSHCFHQGDIDTKYL